VDSLLEFTIVRDKIPIRSVPYAYILRPGVGYVRITRFGSRTEEELETALDSLEAEGMEWRVATTPDVQFDEGSKVGLLVKRAVFLVGEGDHEPITS